MGLVHHDEGLAGAGRHGHQHLALAFADGLLDRRIGLYLVRPHAKVLWHGRECLKLSVEVSCHQFVQCRRRVEA